MLPNNTYAEGLYLISLLKKSAGNGQGRRIRHQGLARDGSMPKLSRPPSIPVPLAVRVFGLHLALGLRKREGNPWGNRARAASCKCRVQLPGPRRTRRWLPVSPGQPGNL